MTCTQNEIKHIRGDTLILNGVVKSDWVATNITGSTFLFTLRKWNNKTEYPEIIQKSWIITGAITGEYSIEATAVEMNIDPWIYLYDIQMTDSLGGITTISIGKFIINYDIT